MARENGTYRLKKEYKQAIRDISERYQISEGKAVEHIILTYIANTKEKALKEKFKAIADNETLMLLSYIE